MTFLPIVERELRVAARRRSTFWVRIVGALVAVLIGAGFLAMSTVFGAGFGAVSLGSGLFATLTWISLFAVLGAGLFLTSDCLSEEKREGTIGFLFLTDLRGHDVVAGKLLATSLQGFYALLAVLPILAITFVLGGVTGEQFWKTALALLNALFLSLGAGLFVSALSRDSQKAMAGTLLLLLLLAGGGPAGDAFIAWLRKGSFDPVLSRSSPVYLFIAAGASGGAAFWPALLVNQIVAWTLFAATCVLLPRTWQEKGGESSASASPWTQWWKYGGARRRSALRKKLVEVNPVLWLVCRERWQGDMLWFMALCLTAAFGVLYFNYGDGTGWVFWSYLGGLLTLVLYLGVASQACRFLVDARRSGVLELLLATPLTDREIVRGQWRGLLRMFGLPLLLCLAIQFGGNYLSQVQMLKVMGTAAAAIPATPPPAPTTNGVLTSTTVTVTTTTTTPTGAGSVTFMSGVPGRGPGTLLALATTLASTLAVAGNLVALVWFGMWMAMTSKSGNVATLKTILFVQIIPWFVITFASAMIFPLLMMSSVASGNLAGTSNAIVWYPLLTSGAATVLSLGKDAGFILWARGRLREKFRERAGQSFAPVKTDAPPPLPATIR